MTERSVSRPLDSGEMDSIVEQMNLVNTLWRKQQIGRTYLDFPETFPVREMHGDLLGHLVWDEAETWVFHPVSAEEYDQDVVDRTLGKRLPVEPPEI